MASLKFYWVLLALACLHAASASVVKRDTEPLETVDELDPIKEALESQNKVALIDETPQSDREKRLAVIKSVGIKALLLNLIFNKIDGVLESKTRFISQLEKQNVIKNEKYFGITTTKPPVSGRPRPPSVSTPAPIQFSTSSPVSLVIPDRLYGNSFGLVTNISQTIGDVLFNTADRAQEFTDQISEKVRRKFGFATNLLGSSKSSRSSKS